MEKKKSVLLELIEREREYCESCEIGSKEYVESCERLMKLEGQLASQKDLKGKFVIDCVKVGSGIALPVFGWVVITAFEKDDTIITALKKTIDCFIPRRV